MTCRLIEPTQCICPISQHLKNMKWKREIDQESEARTTFWYCGTAAAKCSGEGTITNSCSALQRARK